MREGPATSAMVVRIQNASRSGSVTRPCRTPDNSPKGSIRSGVLFGPRTTCLVGPFSDFWIEPSPSSLKFGPKPDRTSKISNKIAINSKKSQNARESIVYLFCFRDDPIYSVNLSAAGPLHFPETYQATQTKIMWLGVFPLSSGFNSNQQHCNPLPDHPRLNCKM